MLQHFYHKEFIAHINWDVIISSSLRLLSKMWIWLQMITDVNIEQKIIITMMKNNYFLKNFTSKTEQKERRSCNYIIARNEEF